MPENHPSSAHPSFAATRWTMVLSAGNWKQNSAARSAMEELARSYYLPLYAFARRRGQSPERSEDLVQGFFTQLLEKDSLQQADRTRGKFRTFLLASLKNYIADQWEKDQAQKRGGGTKTIAIDSLDAESRYQIEPEDAETPECVFERRWAWAVLDQVLTKLREQYLVRNQGELFDALKGVLTTSADISDRATISQKLNLDENALNVAAHRLRRRYRELLREEVAQTVASEELVDEEIKYLISCL